MKNNEFILTRIEQGERGTNGRITFNGNHICYTIERPWLDNQRRISCIPEGTYVLKRRFSPKFLWHLHLQDVPDRDLILLHPANTAITELNGCIAPVTAITELGKGIGSKKAVTKLTEVIFPLLSKGETVTLKIQKA